MSEQRRRISPYTDLPPSALLAADLSPLSADGHLDVIAAADEARSQAEAAYLRGVDGFAETLRDPREAVDLLAVERKISTTRADRDIALAHKLMHLLPATFKALAEGRLNRARVDMIDRATTGLSDETARAVDAAISPLAWLKNPQQLGYLLRRTILTIDPQGAAHRRAMAKKNRSVSVENDYDGMATQHWHDTAENIHAVQDRIDTIARELRRKRDPRTMNELRADIMRDLLLGKYSSKTVAHVYVTGNASTILGLDDLPGTLRGYGPITADQLREIALGLQATWTGVLVDDGGYPKKMAEKKYRPSAALKEFVQLRDNTCTFPACYRVADKTDYDHLRPWHLGGPTDSANGRCECRRHHLAKHSGRWKVEVGADGEDIWTSATTRRSYSKTREPLAFAM
ncbi:DUF222 domain-containing protein [Amycolatopsis sp. NPDC059657]|uniref:HNH endonuclease signature motif containing protein n=1 Tax=Amycolatopsis sp. NPDC059657 TaxID=3346899 RepID=UPI00366B5D26